MNSINKYKINLVLLYSFSFLWADCSSQKKEPVIQLNLKIVDSLFNMHGNNLALLPCTRCGCFENAYRVILQKGDKLNYVLLADTACNKFNTRVDHISSQLIDKISDDLYNVVFLKKRNGSVLYHILDIDECKKIKRVAGIFFD